MQSIKQACFYCLHKFWIALAICLVLLATIVSVLRIALPYAESYKHHIEQMLSEQLGATVAIVQLSAAWQKNGPTLILEQASINTGQQRQLYIARTFIRIDFWQSLKRRQLTAEHFELNGLEYWLSAETLLTSENTVSQDPTATFQALEHLFFRRLQGFTVTDSKLILVGQDKSEVVLNLSHLNWRNAGLRHQGYGDIAIAGITKNSLSFILDLHGASLSESSGQLYLQSAELDLLPYFQQWLPQANRLQKARINFSAWGNIEQGKLQLLQLLLAENSLHWQQAEKQQSLKLGAGQLFWQPTADGWSLSTSELMLATPAEQWTGLKLQLKQADEQLLASLQQLPLEAFAPLLAFLADGDEQLKPLVAHQATGLLENLNLSLVSEQFKLYGQFKEFSTQAVADIPGVQQVSGQFWAANHFVWLVVDAEQQALTWDGLFAEDWHYQHIMADIRLQQHNNNWKLTIPQFTLQAEDFNLVAEMQLDFSKQIEMSLLAQVTGLDAAQASRYYPQRYMPKDTRDFLTDAINSGQMQQATLIWQGAFVDYPFAAGEGRFQVKAELENGAFAFAPDWPMLTDLGAELWFDNAAMLIDAHTGYLGLMPITGRVTASIADLSNATQLDVKVTTALDSQTLTDLMLQSPLRNNLGKTLEYLGLSGPVSGEVLLEIGLKEPFVVASGTADLQSISATLTAPAITLDNLNGQVHFRNEQLTGESLNFSWQGFPATGSFSGKQQDAEYQLAIALAGQATAEDLSVLLDPELQQRVTGQFNWDLDLALVLPEQGFSYQAQLTSELYGLGLALPAPYQKDFNEVALLHVMAQGDTEQSDINVSYQPGVHFQAELAHNTAQLNKAQLTLGAEPVALSAGGFSIDVDLPHIALMPWLEFLHPLLAKTSNEQPFLPSFNKLRGKIASIQLPETLSLSNTVFELTSAEQAWKLQLHGTELASRWQFFHDWQEQGIAVQLDYLNLPLADNTADTQHTDGAEQQDDLTPLTAQDWLRQMVPLQLNCNECTIGNYRLGQLRLRALGAGEQWQLTQLTSEYKGNKLHISGTWLPDNTLGKSQFAGNFTSPNLGALLSEYQLSSAISGSRSDIAFELNWPGAPQQFRLNALNGKVQFTLGNGSLTEVSDQGARIFSLFSLDSLLRKLRLDFRDVFSKGFFYNKMSGSLMLHRGVAQTNDFVIDGVPGNLSLQGYADLAKREMDYQMSFAPKVTSSLPVIIAWMVNPVTGLAALALDEVFQSAEVISRINFTVTGSFDHPVVTEVNRHSTEVPVPIRIAQPEALLDDSNQPRSN